MSSTYASVCDLASDDVHVLRSNVGGGGVYLHLGRVLVPVLVPREGQECREERVAALRKLARLAVELADEVEPEGESAWGVVA